MDAINYIFGNGGELNTLNMCSRAVVVFFLALIFIRISGRRSFGIGTALDNIIVVLLGAVLSRTVTGASPFVPTVCASLVIVVFHRVLGWTAVHNAHFNKLSQGSKIILYQNGQLLKNNMLRAQVSEEDIKQGVRASLHTDNLEYIETIYMERNGTITSVLKPEYLRYNDSSR